jgi:tetratricopeptide (TPR) repeat protein
MQGYSTILAVIVSSNIAIGSQMGSALASNVLRPNQAIAAKPAKPTAKPVVSDAEKLIASATDKIEKGKYKEALADLDKAIILDPESARAYNSRGILKDEKLDDAPGAQADLDQAIKLAPKYAEAYNSRANLKKNNLDDATGALADYTQAIKVNPKYSLTITGQICAKISSTTLKEP